MTLPQVSVTYRSSTRHEPVLLDRVVELLRGKRKILDGTLGGGGHALALLEHGAIVTALDRDPQAIAFARERLGSFESSGHFRSILGNYADIDRLGEIAGASFDGILLDLGLSSHQLDEVGRGFSFREGEPLDMRMGEDANDTAAGYLNSADERDIARVLRDFGDEPHAARLAREITRRRANRPFRVSDDLVGAIRGALGSRTGPPDFARLFQAVRIEVNDELAGLERALPLLRNRLEPHGALVVIAYHSGEDRLVKHAFRLWSASCVCPPRQPVCTCRGRPLGTTLTRKAIVPAGEETARNPRARSAKLRAWQGAA